MLRIIDLEKACTSAIIIANTGVNVNYTGGTVNTLFLEYLVRGFYLFQIKQLNIFTATSIKVVLPKAYQAVNCERARDDISLLIFICKHRIISLKQH